MPLASDALIEAPTLFFAKVLVEYELTNVSWSSVVPWLPIHGEVRTVSPVMDQDEDSG